MTEQEWLACADPHTMLAFLGENRQARKYWLFSCAMAQKSDWMNVEGYAAVVQTAEKMVEGQADMEDLRQCWVAYAERHCLPADKQHLHIYEDKPPIGPGSWNPPHLAVLTALLVGPAHFGYHWETSETYFSDWQQFLCCLFRDIFGPLPFHVIRIDPTWLFRNDSTVRKLAQAIYDERAFDRMPILADALEDAGCANADILNHCRSTELHVKGCWVVDALLGKE